MSMLDLIYFTLYYFYNIQLLTLPQAPLQDKKTRNHEYCKADAYVNLNMPILAINMFPSQHSIRRGALEQLDCSACIESTSSNDHFNLSSASGFLSHLEGSRNAEGNKKQRETYRMKRETGRTRHETCWTLGTS